MTTQSGPRARLLLRPLRGDARRAANLQTEKDTDMAEFNSTDDKRAENSGARSKYRELTQHEKDLIDAVKKSGDCFIGEMRELIMEKSQASREFSLAITHMEDAVMRAVRGITQ